MSRILLACSFVAALCSAASADRAYVPSHFAQPPVAESVAAPSLDRAAIRDALLRAREANLEAFRAYVRGGVFPSNVYKPGALNVWRDQDGHYCAAATIIKQSGQDELVARVADQNNFIRLADVQQGPLMDWILTSGLTQEEIVEIQKPFMPVTERPQPVPVAHVDIDANLRTQENARLRAKYKAVDKMIVEHQKQSLDIAVDRLMKHPTLAWNLIAG